MDNVTLNNITKSCREELSALSIGSGLDQLKIITRYCSNSQIIFQVEEIEENYHSMLSFLAEGGKDEERSLTQKRISQKALEILRIAHRDIRLQEMRDKYSKAFQELQMLYGSEPQEALLKKWGTNLLSDEQMITQDHLFLLIWTSPLWTQKQTAYWYEFMSRQIDNVKIHLVGAVFLSLWEYFDVEKLSFLFFYTETENKKLNALSVTALLFLAEKYQQELIRYPELCKRYQEKPIKSHIIEVITEKIRIHQTLLALNEEERIIAEFSLNMSQDEVTRLMNKKMSLLHKMIEGGLDVNMGNRIALWNRSDFLRDNISHWFVPFEKTSPAIQDLLLDKDGNFKSESYKILDVPNECDIDRYAIYSFMAKTNLKNNFLDVIAKGFEEIEQSIEGDIYIEVKHYKVTMQNLYRIFAHSPIKSEIENPFSWPYNFWQNSIFQNHFSEEQTIELCTEMMVAKIYDQPVAWLEKLEETSGTSQVMLMIKSKCLYYSENYHQAIASLTQMLFLDEENELALGLIQKCYGKIGRKDKQLEYIQKLLALKPDEVTYLTSAAIVLIEMEKYDEALEHLFHLDILEPGNPHYMVSIEICAIHLKKFDLALRYNHAILENSDYKDKYLEYLNAGHIHFIMGDWKEALNCYRKFKDEVEIINRDGKILIDLDKEFISSAKILKKMDISPSDIQLMRDMIQL